MFYSNNDGYMQDLYFYNQMPNNTYMNSFGNNMMGNPNMQMMNNAMPNNIQPNNQMMQNPTMFSNNIPVQNLNNLYPSIYRILNPVVSRVVSNNNQPISEDLLNNMTDTVFNIVEGQVDLGNDQIQRNTQNENQSSSNTTSNTSTNNSTSSRTTETRQQSNTQTSFRNNRNESLLRDLIKILIIKDLLSRNQFQRQFSQNSFYNTPPFYMSM